MLAKNVRQASHAGSWYLADKKKLDDQLESWLEPTKDNLKIKALIGPYIKKFFLSNIYFKTCWLVLLW